jgi:hypothetical protein
MRRRGGPRRRHLPLRSPWVAAAAVVVLRGRGVWEPRKEKKNRGRWRRWKWIRAAPPRRRRRVTVAVAGGFPPGCSMRLRCEKRRGKGLGLGRGAGRAKGRGFYSSEIRSWPLDQIGRLRFQLAGSGQIWPRRVREIPAQAQVTAWARGAGDGRAQSRPAGPHSDWAVSAAGRN